MAESSLLKTGEKAPTVAGGDTRTLGPSDSTDSGSDLVAGPVSDEALASDSDAAGTGERASANRRDNGDIGADIGTDRIEESPIDDDAD